MTKPIRSYNRARRRAERRLHPNFEICWHGDDPTYSVKLETHKDLIASFYDRSGCGIAGGPAGLCFHHVFLTKDMEGPCVFVWGEKKTPSTFHCEYHTHTEWITSAQAMMLNHESSESASPVLTDIL